MSGHEERCLLARKALLTLLESGGLDGAGAPGEGPDQLMLWSHLWDCGGGEFSLSNTSGTLSWLNLIYLIKCLSPACNSQPFIPALPDAFVARALANLVPLAVPIEVPFFSSQRCTITLIIIYFLPTCLNDVPLHFRCPHVFLFLFTCFKSILVT